MDPIPEYLRFPNARIPAPTLMRPVPTIAAFLLTAALNITALNTVAINAMVPPVDAAPAADVTQPLPSWREGPAKARLLSFVEAVSREGSPDYVPPAERIVVFDHDGTLWGEQPMYAQVAFALERARALVAQRPELATSPVIAAAAAGDLNAVMAHGSEGVLELVALTHGGLSTDAFKELVQGWFRTACHPTLKRPYTALTYAPMRELLDLLRARGFQTWIVSGGGKDFVRLVSEGLYGIPPEQVVGSTVRSEYVVQNGVPTILRRPEVAFIDDGAGKPVGIHDAIGRRPIAAFGNSDGDLAMLEWTTAGTGNRLGMLLHHDDGEREFAYDRHTLFGRLDRALKEAPKRGWTMVSMRNDWARIYPANQPIKPGVCPPGG
jgi:phosphoserine phosphatase